MSIYGDIWNKLTGGSTPSTTDTAVQTAASTTTSEVNVEKILTTMAAQKPEAANWQTSIVDLLKVLDLDSSLANRKELADELGVKAGADGSAEQNTALHRAVIQKLEENGGKVSDSLKV